MTGAGGGEGDLEMRRAYNLVQKNPNINRINIELDTGIYGQRYLI